MQTVSQPGRWASETFLNPKCYSIDGLSVLPAESLTLIICERRETLRVAFDELLPP